MSNESLVIVAIVIIITLGFDFVNGFHDTANSIATSVVTKALTPFQAIFMASVLELFGAFLSTKVAKTVGTDIVNANIINLRVIIAALFAAILWNLITWYFGIPSSSSHALIGGLIGSAISKANNLDVVYWGHLLYKVVLPLLLSPVIGLIAGSFIMILLLWIIKPFRPKLIKKWFSKLQILSSGLVALSHGSNDAQKSMGIITLALLLGGKIEVFEVPIWVTVACAVTLALGTATGGWKIIKTMGNNISKLNPVSGFAAQAATIGVINSATFLIGAPVSTTHIMSSSIMGAGATKRLSAVRWGIARELVYTWMITIPSCAIMGAVLYKIVALL